MTKDEYVEHEVRLRMLEQTCKQLNTKMNTLIMLALTSLILPALYKYIGF